MTKTRKLDRGSVVLALAVFGATLLSFAGPALAEAPGDVVVVVSAKNPQGSVSADDVRSAYLGNKTFWPGQVAVTPLRRADSHGASASFFDGVVGKSASAFHLYWRKRALAGKGTEPKAMDDAKALLKRVAGDKGAIGYVLRSELTAAGAGGVKIVHVIPAK